MYRRTALIASAICVVLSLGGKGQEPVPADKEAAGTLQAPVSDGYVLGPEDTLSIRIVDNDEIGAAPYPIDLRGKLDLPRIGSIQAAGLTVDELQDLLTDRFKEFLQNPIVNVSVAEYHSQPISIVGAVMNPGVHQIRGRMTLLEAISEAGGLDQQAGDSIKITRRLEFGAVSLPNATTDASGKYSVAEVSIRSLMRAENPGENIAVKPYDAITVPKAELVYVVGAVKKAGGFVLSEKSNLSALEALSMAEGLDHAAGARDAKILRAAAGSTQRTEIPIDLKKILEGKAPDVQLLATDILFVPTSAAKNASLRAIEAMIQTGTGLAVYGRY